jgi:glycosyltransferase involved in cell wall biosynthesis
MMNIAVVADYLYPDVVGGSWNYAHDLAQRLARRGHHCWGISAHPGGASLPYRQRIDAIEFHRYPQRRGSHLLSFASRVTGSLRTMQRIARSHPIDVIHTHAPMGAIGTLFSPSARGIPRIATVHGTGVLAEYLCELAALEASRRSRRAYCAAIDGVERWYLRKASRVHALSRFSGDTFVAQHGLDPERVSILSPGVDLDRFRPGPADVARQRLGLPPDRPILFTVRRLTARMGLDLCLRAARRIADELPEVLLLIGGKGPMRSQLE